MGQDGVHTLDQGAWHYCGRCDEREKLNLMLWQNGVLLCPECVDEFPATPGIRERMIDQVLSDGQNEFEPDAKLTNPENDIALDVEDPGPVGF
jgi:hypothetical protein